MSMRIIKKCVKKALAARSAEPVNKLDLRRPLAAAPPLGFGFQSEASLNGFVNQDVIPCLRSKYPAITFTIDHASELLAAGGDGFALVTKLVQLAWSSS